MNRDDIILMARKYGCVIAEDGPDSQFEVSFHADQITAMVRAAQAAEHEAVIAIVNDNTDGDGLCCADDLLAAIRARGEK